MVNEEFIPMINEEDKMLIEKLINEYEIKIDNFHINLENNKYISGIFGNVNSDIKKVFRYNHFLESINDLSHKTKKSIEKCVEAYQETNIKDFNPMSNQISKKENEAYYYMENALFREVILWDSLAQLYNLYYDRGIDVEKIHYKKVIERLSQKNINEIDFAEILRYLKEDYNIGENNIDKGIHKCISNVRNQMTHRFSIAITAFSENCKENATLRAMPDLIYKIAKDYNIVQKYLVQIIKMITKEIDTILNECQLFN